MKKILLISSLLTLLFTQNSFAVHDAIPAKRQNALRIATFNASLNRAEEGELLKDLRDNQDRQIQNIAYIIQHVNPDILLVNEFDYDPQGQACLLFQENYLKKSWYNSSPLHFPYYFTAPVNTGVSSGLDLDQNGKLGEANDALGYGAFPGQYGMVIFSKLPIAVKEARTFQKFLWQDMPQALLPDNPQTPEPNDWYSKEALGILPLSSKSHWDIPVQVGSDKVIHILASHPTPPVFDGAEDRNGKRNHDEIRFWADYLTPTKADYIYDDKKQKGGLGEQDSFVIVGDLNADSHDGDGRHEAIQNLLQHSRIQSASIPESAGAAEASQQQGKDNANHKGNPAHDTADFTEPPGNLRADYVLPSNNMTIVQSGVFWPSTHNPIHPLTNNPKASSDHHLVWVDVIIE